MASVLSDKTNTAGGKKIEQIYQKKTQLEHILLRPDTYVGSLEHVSLNTWVFDLESECMVERDITYVPGLYKIFDEILVNAADNKQRDATQTTIKVDIDTEKNCISVYNDGKGIPVVEHAEYKVYVPELIFGHLLTSSNYDDTVKKTTGGRNGYGAKLTNIFSSKFIIETVDGERGLQYKQVFRNNMQKKDAPEIKKSKSKNDWTKVTFYPDLERFNMQDGIDPDMISLMYKRVHDIAGTTRGVHVYLNGEKLKIKSFKDYVELYVKSPLSELSSQGKPKIVYEIPHERWEVAVTVSSDGQFQQVSFVNNICTIKGGSHVGLVTDSVTKKILEMVNGKKNAKKTSLLKPHQLKAHCFVFVNALVENPAFDSQTKETLTTVQSKFGSKPEFSDKFFKDCSKVGMVERAQAYMKAKESTQLKKQDGKKQLRLAGIPKLDDANMAGTRQSHKCTLILTEGDSAKALAVSGLSVIGRDYYGVFPLRGKLLNVRDASSKQIMDNEEIKNIKKILALKHGVEYTDTKQLRYGSIMIMADQDHDGSHIKGLVLNFIHQFWPSLLKVPGFMCEFVTPIVKATKGKVIRSFFTMPEYEHWLHNNKEANHGRGWHIKYYKGLGTSTAAEAKEYFSKLDKHRIEFGYNPDSDDDALDLVFSKKRADERKEWLKGYRNGVHVDHDEKELGINDFVNKELILFSMADNVRSIPSMIDGLKPGQRKILYSCFKRRLNKNEIKVAQLAGYVSEHSAYHHGEQSLANAIVGMAQDFVGTNNINLLMPVGQFGTRLQGGKDAASPRYVFTKLTHLTRLMFAELDDAVLTYLNEDGQSIEPEFYVPILPTVLVNGADGIGTGWSTSIPNYHPMDIVENIRRWIGKNELQQMTPWYRGFNGEIVPRIAARSGQQTGWEIRGTIEKIDDTTLEITELPIRKWTQDYKEFLESMMPGAAPTTTAAKKKKSKDDDDNGNSESGFIEDYKEYHTDTLVKFRVTLSEEKMMEAEEIGLEKKFKLASSLTTNNMHMFDAAGRICHYPCPEAVISEFCDLRLQYYEKRKQNMVETLTAEWTKLDNKVKFILAVINGDIVIANRKKDDIMKQLDKDGYTPLPPAEKKKKASDDEDGDDGDDIVTEKAAIEAAKHPKRFDYLLGMPLWTLTRERVDELQKDLKTKENELNTLLRTSPSTLWERDLAAFEEAFLQWEEVSELVSINRPGLGDAVDASRLEVGNVLDDTTSSASKSVNESVSTTASRKAPVAKKPAASKAAASSKLATKKQVFSLCESDESDDDGFGSMSLVDRLNMRLKSDKTAAPPKKAAAAKKPAAKKAPAKKAAAVKKEESDDDAFMLDSESENEAPAPAPRSRTARTATQKKKTTTTYVFSSDEEESDVDLLSDGDDDAFSAASDDAFSPPKPAKAKPAAKKPAARKLASKAKIDLEESIDQIAAMSINDDDDMKPEPKKATATKKSTTTAAKKTAAAKKAPAKKAPAKKAPAKKPAAKKPAAKKVESDDEFDFDDGSDSEAEAAPAPRARTGRRAATTKKSKYVDSDSEVEMFSESDDDFDVPSDDDSDFEM